MRPMWMIRGGCGLLLWIVSVVGQAHAGRISPVAPGSGATLSIFQDPTALIDITDQYLPEWAPLAPLQTVYIVVNNGSGTAPTLVDLNPLITAANPNPFLAPRRPLTILELHEHRNGYRSRLHAITRVTLPDLRVVYALVSNDCGGMAVIQVGNDRFVVPRDTNLNGIADSWEAIFCPGNSCPAGTEDADASPNNAGIGDGFAALDEYRGFIVSGVHVRTDPRQKNFLRPPGESSVRHGQSCRRGHQDVRHG